MTVFVIHALSVAGGILAIAPLPGVHGDYAQDIAHLRDWKPALVISMTTLPEMVSYHAEGLGADMQGSGSRWVHLPVEDYDIPDAEQNTLWPEISKTAIAALRGGGRVLVHCRGGCGRSGMAALRLMIDAGEAPEAALLRLRSVRPCAVETDAQLIWAQTRGKG